MLILKSTRRKEMILSNCGQRLSSQHVIMGKKI